MTDLDAYLGPISVGDTRAFGLWMARVEATVRGSLRGFAAKVDTESVVQETFLRVWQHAPGFVSDGKPNSLLRLSLRIARNLAISETRRLRTASAYEDELEHRAAFEHGSPSPPDPMLRELIEGCRDRLPARPAQALTERLRSGGGERDADIAARIGMTRNTFLQNFTRARKFLATCLGEHGVDITGGVA